jgi:hypothetical protein
LSPPSQLTIAPISRAYNALVALRPLTQLTGLTAASKLHFPDLQTGRKVTKVWAELSAITILFIAVVETPLKSKLDAVNTVASQKLNTTGIIKASLPAASSQSTVLSQRH